MWAIFDAGLHGHSPSLATRRVGLSAWSFPGPCLWWLRALYDWYSFRLLPWIGTKVAHDTPVSMNTSRLPFGTFPIRND